MLVDGHEVLTVRSTCDVGEAQGLSLDGAVARLLVVGDAPAVDAEGLLATHHTIFTPGYTPVNLLP